MSAVISMLLPVTLLLPPQLWLQLLLVLMLLLLLQLLRLCTTPCSTNRDLENRDEYISPMNILPAQHPDTHMRETTREDQRQHAR